METPPDLNHEEMLSALFAQLVMQQTNLALMLLGKIPNPATGETKRDVEAARFFIDQLEMLEVKTRGNLTPPEANLLKQSLMSLHLAFVEAMEAPDPKEPAAGPDKPANPPPAGAGTEKPAEQPGTPQTKDEPPSARKFSKKY